MDPRYIMYHASIIISSSSPPPCALSLCPSSIFHSRRLEDLTAELNRTLLKVKANQASVNQPAIDITATPPPPPPPAQSSPGRRSPPRASSSPSRLVGAGGGGGIGMTSQTSSNSLVTALERKVMELQERAETFEEEKEKAVR